MPRHRQSGAQIAKARRDAARRSKEAEKRARVLRRKLDIEKRKREAELNRPLTPEEYKEVKQKVRLPKIKRPKQPRKPRQPLKPGMRKPRTVRPPPPTDRWIAVVSRKGQPQAKIQIPLSQAPTGIATVGGPVSSSWIAAIRWDNGIKAAFMRTLDTRYGPYKVNIPWMLFEEWYYAHSKGTFFNQAIKGKFTVTSWQ